MRKDYSESLNHLAWHIVCFNNNKYLASFFNLDIVWNEKSPSNVTCSCHFTFRQQRLDTIGWHRTGIISDPNASRRHPVEQIHRFDNFPEYSRLKLLDRGSFCLSYSQEKTPLKMLPILGKKLVPENSVQNAFINTIWIGLWPRLFTTN